MLWDRSNRFTATKKDEKILTYESFSDYLRHQFLQSRNLFHHYQEYRKSQKQKKYKHDPRKIHHDFQSPHHHEEGITPATSLTEDAPKVRTLFVFLFPFLNVACRMMEEMKILFS